MPSISLPAAILGAGVIGGVATAIGASSAASAQKKAALSAQQTQKDMFNQAAGYDQPFIQGGQQAYGTLNDLLGVGGNSATMQSTLEGLPGYTFTRDQGLKSVQNSYAARGLADSGGAEKGAATFATGLANNTWGTYADRLANSAGIGAGAAESLSGNAVTTGQGIAGSQIGAGNAAAGAATATGAAVGNAVNPLAQYYTLTNLLNSNSGSSSTSPNYYFDTGSSNYQNG